MTRELRNVPASVYARLRSRALERGEAVPFVHQRYAAERLLYRLGQSPYHDRFVLRGAMLYPVWGEDAYRPTVDLDLLGHGSPEPAAIEACFLDLCATEVQDDGLRFEPGTVRVRPMREGAQYSGVEVRLEVRLMSARIPLKVDVGFGDVVVPRPQRRSYPPLLEGPAPVVRVYSRESVIAEKLHAAVFFGDRNTRMKDFYDLYVLAQRFSFEGSTLTRAIAATFERRGLPLQAEEMLPAAFFGDATRAGRWQAYLEKTGLLGVPNDFAVVGEVLRSFLVGPTEALAAGAEFPAAWQPGGPWR